MKYTTDTESRAFAQRELRHAQARLCEAQELARDAIEARRAAVKEARAAGLTTTDIADALGVTRQAVHALS